MKRIFPPQNQEYKYLQTNRSDLLGSLWATFNLDFITKLGQMLLSKKLVTNTTSSDDSDLGLPVAFEFWYGTWWAICGTRIFKNSSAELTAGFTEDTATAYKVGDSTTQFDVTNPAGTTFRYTYDATGTDPEITALTFPIGGTVVINGTNLAAGNRGTFTITGSGANYFEVTNAGGVAEVNKTIGTGFISIAGGTIGQDYSSIASDMLVFNDKLWVTTGLKLRSRSNDSAAVPWGNVDTFTSAVPHKLAYFKKFDRLYVIKSSSSIHSVDTSDVVSTSGDYTLNPGTSVGYISTIVANASFLWVGTFRDNTAFNSSASEQKGSILQWDGVSQQVTNEFVIDAGGVLAMCVVDDIPYALDTEGRILKYTGYSFKEIARLPIENTLLTNPTALAVNHFVHFNGMVGTKNNTIQVLINNLNDDAAADVTENLPSGIWELDLNTNNFTHRYSPTLKSRSSSTITDYGQSRISAPGALKQNYLQSNSGNGRSTLIAGFNYFTDATTVKSGIFIDSPAKPTTDTEGQKRGYFVTTWFLAEEVAETWVKLWAIFRRFLSATDKITFKYRVSEESPVLATITWVDTTHFTTTTDVSAYDPSQSPFDGTNGGEVEILQGVGAGACVHISAVSAPSGGVYTVTLDTAVTGATITTGKARFQKWIKLLPELTGQVLSAGGVPINNSDTRIQIKGVCEWTGDNQFFKMLLYSKESINADS